MAADIAVRNLPNDTTINNHTLPQYFLEAIPSLLAPR
jgi:hypothetical protein